MRIEAPVAVNEVGFPLETEDRVEIYKELASPIYKRLEESKLGTAFLELSELPKKDVELIRSGVRYHIQKEGGGYTYPLHSKIITEPSDRQHHILVFSKNRWDEVVWEEILSKIE